MPSKRLFAGARATKKHKSKKSTGEGPGAAESQDDPTMQAPSTDHTPSTRRGRRAAAKDAKHAATNSPSNMPHRKNPTQGPSSAPRIDTPKKHRVSKFRASAEGSPSRVPATPSRRSAKRTNKEAAPTPLDSPVKHREPDAVHRSVLSSDGAETHAETQTAVSMGEDGEQTPLHDEKQPSHPLESPPAEFVQAAPQASAPAQEQPLETELSPQILPTSPLGTQKALANKSSNSPESPVKQNASSPEPEDQPAVEENPPIGSPAEEAGLHDNPEQETRYLEETSGSDATPFSTPSKERVPTGRPTYEPQTGERQVDGSKVPIYDAEAGEHANQTLKQTSYFSHDDEALMLNVLRAVHGHASYTFIALVLQEIYSELDWPGYKRYCSRDDGVSDITDRRIGIKLAKLRNKNKNNDAYNIYSDDLKDWYAKAEELAIERVRTQAPKKRPLSKELPPTAGVPERLRYTMEEEVMLRHWLIQGRGNKYIQGEYRNLRPLNAIKQKMQKLRKQLSSKSNGVYTPLYPVTPDGHYDESKENFVGEGEYPESDYDAFLRRLDELDEIESTMGPKIRAPGKMRSIEKAVEQSVDQDIAMFDETTDFDNLKMQPSESEQASSDANGEATNPSAEVIVQEEAAGQQNGTGRPGAEANDQKPAEEKPAGEQSESQAKPDHADADAQPKPRKRRRILGITW